MTKVLRPNRGVPLLRRIGMGLFAVIALLLWISGLSQLGTQLSTAVLLLAMSLMFVVLVLVLRSSRSRAPGLTVTVRPDGLEFSRPGIPPEAIARADVGLIVLDVKATSGGTGLTAFRLYRPDRSLLGLWETGWEEAGPIRSIRAFRRYGYPWIVHDSWAVAWKDKVRSKSAPSWAEQVARS